MAAVELSADDVAAARAATPGCRDDLIHLNYAGAALPPQVVLDAQIDFLRAEAMDGGYEVADRHADRVEAVYASIARMIRAGDPSEIAWFESATDAWNAAFWSIPMKAGQRIIVHDHEYGANAVAFMHAARTRDIVIDRVPSDETGQVSLDAMSAALADPSDVALVSLTHVPTNGGLVNPAEEIGALTRSAGVPYLVDACQSAGQVDLDVEAIGCDFLTATGRKFLRGPRGTGFLYARRSILERVMPSQPDHHGALWRRTDGYDFVEGARRFEHFEHSFAGWLGLGAAVDHALGWGLDRVEMTVAARAAELRAMLRDAGYGLYDAGTRQCGIVTTAHPERSAVDLHATLMAAGVNTSLTHIGSCRYDVEARNLPRLVRMSVHYTTTTDELTRAVAALR